MTQVGDAPTERKITRLAIGIDGGFDPDEENKKYKTIEKYSIVVLPSFESIPFETSELPQNVNILLCIIIYYIIYSHYIFAE